MIKCQIAILLVSILISHISASCQEVVLSGNYQGRDLFIQNPYNKSTKKFCTEGIYLNNELIIQNPSISAIRVDMSDISLDAFVEVRITHSTGCIPSIVNPEVLKSADSFQFMATEADNGSITWSTKGEKNGGTLYIMQSTKKTNWAVIDTIAGKGSSEINRYAIPPIHRLGLNNYKVEYISPSGNKFESPVFNYTASEKYITFYPQIATTTLTLSDSTNYEVEDYFGKVLMKGEGKQVLVLNLKPGKYYLVIQNRKEQFIKK